MKGLILTNTLKQLPGPKTRNSMTRNPQLSKICLVTLSLGKGGAERSCALLSRMLEKQGHEVHTVILIDEIDYEYAGKLFNLGKLKTKMDTLSQRLWRFKKLRKYLKENRFDVVIDHRPKNDFPREVFYDKLIYRGIPLIYVVHSSFQKNYFTEKPGKMVDIYNKNLTNIAVSEHIEKNMQNLGVKNIQLVHNAVDPAWGKTKSEIPENLQNGNYLLWYGRIDNSVKDLPFLLESFQLSELWKTNIQLVIMGSGKDLPKAKQEASLLPCCDKVVFLPFTKNPFPVISSARAVVLTSNYEGFPMVLTESLSVGTPVVSLDIVSGPSEVIDHQKNGLLVAGRNSKNFANALREICFDEDLYQTCKSNAKNSVTDFSMENIGKKWNELLQTHLKAVK